MNKTKKIILFSFLALILIIGIVFGANYLYKLNKVVSIVTIDINPSIRVSLNYKKEVIKIEGLNKDGEKIIKNSKFENKSLEKAIEEISKQAIEEGYITEEDNSILINVEGKDIKKEVVNLIETEFKNKKTECNIIIQNIDEKAIENAKKYDISESKASYIENLIKDNSDIKFEDLAEKSINEINQIIEEKNTEVEQKSEEVKKEEEKKVEPQTPSVNIKPKKVYKTPANDDRSGAWCDFLDSLPPEGGVDYETPGVEKDLNKFKEVAKNYIQDDIDLIDLGGSPYGRYEKGSYCSAGYITGLNISKTKRYDVYMDSVTLEVLEFKITEIEQPKFNEEAATVIFKKWVLDTYGVDIDSCNPTISNAYYSIHGITNIPEWQFSTKCNSPEIKYYAGNVNGRTGEITNGRTWGANGF